MPATHPVGSSVAGAVVLRSEAASDTDNSNSRDVETDRVPEVGSVTLQKPRVAIDNVLASDAHLAESDGVEERPDAVVAEPTTQKCSTSNISDGTRPTNPAPQSDRQSGQQQDSSLSHTSSVAATSSPLLQARGRYIPHDVVRFVYRRAQGRCEDCGYSGHLEIDHLIPFSERPICTADELLLRCRSCHTQRHEIDFKTRPDWQIARSMAIDAAEMIAQGVTMEEIYGKTG